MGSATCTSGGLTCVTEPVPCCDRNHGGAISAVATGPYLIGKIPQLLHRTHSAWLGSPSPRPFAGLVIALPVRHVPHWRPCCHGRVYPADTDLRKARRSAVHRPRRRPHQTLSRRRARRTADKSTESTKSPSGT